jgi:hypothetical protein
MITRNGYVCIAENYNTWINMIYGKTDSKISSTPFSQTLIPFPCLITAKSAKLGLELKLKNNFDRIAIAKLNLKIAQTKEEFEKLNKKDLVVIATNDSFNEIEYRIYGDLKNGAAQPGETLTQNGLKLYQDIEKAIEMVFQMNRQAEMPATIANFNLEYLA